MRTVRVVTVGLSDFLRARRARGLDGGRGPRREAALRAAARQFWRPDARVMATVLDDVFTSALREVADRLAQTLRTGRWRSGA